MANSTAGNWYPSTDMDSQQDYGLRPGYGDFHLPSSLGHCDDTQTSHVPQDFTSMEQSYVGQLDSRNDPLRMLDSQSSPVQCSGSRAFVSLSYWGPAVHHSAAYPNCLTSLPESRPVEQAVQSQAPDRWLQTQICQAYTNNAGLINASETSNLDISCLVTDASGQVLQSSENLNFKNQRLPNGIPRIRVGNGEMPWQDMLRQNWFNSLESQRFQPQQIGGFAGSFVGEFPAGPSRSTDNSRSPTRNFAGAQQTNWIHQNREIHSRGSRTSEFYNRLNRSSAMPRATQALTPSAASTQSTFDSIPGSFIWDPESDSLVEETRSRRPQSEDQKAHRRKVRNAGGACTRCKKYHRRVCC
ncbi:hypothetical protein T310_9451 [Rasamsonia emersonii CBS 393.64]|uniref:Uncharacterized protein n=1 Tax=Rasamsonia emersonii (strain ATCC 16479 / CBS 393.64 / IMI 116815) TaxID=1408163 RepID=A0A0F4YFL3_RASE3|nr:hypothetical protein T310_9451 [Rasamsonia emersonii CBS 393.64]KKA16930.1 hypothetical protein T310_9451 [Rasamsonia emersonii CBS 393.64]